MVKMQIYSQGARGPIVTYSQLVGGRTGLITQVFRLLVQCSLLSPSRVMDPQASVKHSPAIYIPLLDTPFSVSEISPVVGMKRLVL